MSSLAKLKVLRRCYEDQARKKIDSLRQALDDGAKVTARTQMRLLQELLCLIDKQNDGISKLTEDNEILEEEIRHSLLFRKDVSDALTRAGDWLNEAGNVATNAGNSSPRSHSGSHATGSRPTGGSGRSLITEVLEKEVDLSFSQSLQRIGFGEKKSNVEERPVNRDSRGFERKEPILPTGILLEERSSTTKIRKISNISLNE